MFHFENTAIWTSEFSQCMTSKWQCCFVWKKKTSPLDFQRYNHFQYYKICLCAPMLALEWKERAFIEKVNSWWFCWFPTAMLVDHQYGVSHTKLYKVVWNVSANNSETVGHKDLGLGQIVYILVFYNISFSWFPIYFFVARQWKQSIFRLRL